MEKIVIYTLEDGKDLTPEQLAEFRPVNFAIMEERAKAMRKAGIFDPEEIGKEADLVSAPRK